ETSDHLNNLIRYTNAPIIVWNPDKKITIFNEAFEEMSGRSEAEMVGQLLDVLFPEESRSDSLRKIESASKGEYWETVEIPILHKDGNIRIGLWNSANIYGEDGKTLIATIAQGQDITERKRTEDALRKSEERYRTLQTNIPVGIFRTTPEGKFLSANPTLIKMLGYDSQEELLVTSVVDIYITPEQRQEFIKRMNKEGLVVDFEVKLRRKDGLTFWGSLSATAVTDRTGKVIHYDGILEDITEHKHAEQELKKRLDQLEIYYKATMGREGRIVELKREVNELSEQLGKEKKYGV
ncbi:PAS domain-containing protein, partial [candidate division WOR-3 bacterium]|nr:PAS domain-containing protein [candidate division WOR-3 bacterium]